MVCYTIVLQVFFYRYSQNVYVWQTLQNENLSEDSLPIII